MKSDNGKVGFISLGCPKNTVDSERIITKLRADGYAIVPGYEQADLVIVNTCAFINSAVEESLATIGEAVNKNGKVLVTGCLGHRADEIKSLHPSVLSISGPESWEAVVKQVHAVLPPEHSDFTSLIPTSGIKLTPRHYAYLKISEGCNHTCSFCIIPSLRGKLKSRSIGEVLDEAAALANDGVKELLVISQDTSAYGIDLKYRTGFWHGRPIKTQMFDLCNALSELGIWIRLHYVYPYPHVDNIIPLMADGGVLPYLDIPFQHASPSILRAMRRPAASEKVLDRISNWRTQCPDLHIRSTFIVGFPGETDEDFATLLQFLDSAQLDRVGCFKYSDVAGAAANEYPNQVPEHIKDERYQQFMSHQQSISTKRLAAMVGHSVDVIIDEVVSEGAVGRTIFDAPEIDGQVFLDGQTQLVAGDILTVEIEDSDEYDLWAKPAI